MELYIDGKSDYFASFFENLPKSQQDEIISDYIRSPLLGGGGRIFCERYAVTIIQREGIKLGEYTYESLVDEMMVFLEPRRTQVYGDWQHRILRWLDSTAARI